MSDAEVTIFFDKLQGRQEEVIVRNVHAYYGTEYYNSLLIKMTDCHVFSC
jgi:hypothetical protein